MCDHKALCGIERIVGSRWFNYASRDEALQDLSAGSADGKGYDLVSSKWCINCLKVLES